MKQTEQNDRLPPTLASWRVSPPADPNFRPAVWQRIERRPGETWRAHVRRNLVGWCVTAALAIAVAGWTGHAVAEARLDASRDQMVANYLSALDPRAMANFRR